MMDFNPFYNAYNQKLLSFEHAWGNFIKTGEINYSVIRKEVAESWERCHAMNLNPLTTISPTILNENQLKDRIERRNNLVNTAWPFMKSLYELAKDSGFHVNLVDEEGYILKGIGDKDALKFCQKNNSFPGANRLEEISGTTSISLAITHKKPFQVVGAEHYIQVFQNWACSAAPIFDDKNSLLGVLSMSGRSELVHQHTLGMVVSTAKAIENELKLQKINIQLLQNNSQLKATLKSVTDGVIYVNSKGIVTQTNYEIEKFLDIDVNKIIEKKVTDIINSSPSLKTILNSADTLNHYEIIINSKNKSYSCLLNIKAIYNEKNEITGVVLIFTKIKEIHKLTNHISKNTAYFTFDNLIGQSPKFKEAINLAKKAAGMHFRVLIEGESGTGKEMFAQAIHNSSSRQNMPFIAVDCGAIPRELVESELFGYESGAFTGARKGGKAGKFELANGGTIFLDEIGNMPIEMQVKILRVLQEKQVTRIGGFQPIPIDVRVIAATNANLETEVKKNNFREDLFYRLNVFYIKIPSLRDRKEDIPILVNHFLQTNHSILNNRKINHQVMKILINYNWPGNIRQLHNVIERCIAMAKGVYIRIKDLPPELVIENSSYVINNETKILSLEDATVEYILKILELTNGNITKAAEILKVTRTTIYNAIKKTNSFL